MATGEKKSGFTWPEWRLYANFLHRELARLWYGKKSVFTLVKGDDENRDFWETFGLIFTATICRFGKSHGVALAGKKLAKHIIRAYEEYKKLTGLGFPFGTPGHEIYWFARRLLGDRLASEFLFDMQITEIVILVVCAYGYAVEGKMPPYEKHENLRPLEFYEGLPVAPELEAQFYGKNPSPKP